MNKSVTTLTRSGYKALEDELTYLITVRRVEITEQLKEARSHGDLSENSEYDAAKDAQAQMEARIAEIQAILKNAQVIEDDEISTDKVGIGTVIKILDKEMNEEMEFSIVGTNEANISAGKLSDESPIGAALVGHKIGETVEVETPSGILAFEILDTRKKEAHQ